MPIPDKPNLAAEQAKLHANEYPLPAFYFAVFIGESGETPPPQKSGISQSFKKLEKSDTLISASFTEVSGLTQEIQSLDYREGTDKVTVPRKIPGMVKYSNVTLKRGIFLQNTKFQTWLNEKNFNNIKRELVIIELKNPEGKTVISWTLSNAYPVKIDGPALKSDGNEVAVESIELVHEGITVKYESN